VIFRYALFASWSDRGRQLDGKRNMPANVLSAPRRGTVPSVQVVARHQHAGRPCTWCAESHKTMDVCVQSRAALAQKPSPIHSAWLCGMCGTVQSLRFCRLHFRHWLSTLHRCCPNLLCADLRRGYRRMSTRVTFAAVALPALSKPDSSRRVGRLTCTLRPPLLLDFSEFS
jgi:hypothetical protein